MEKKAEFERQGKMGNRSQDSLSKEVFPIWKVWITLDYPNTQVTYTVVKFPPCA